MGRIQKLTVANYRSIQGPLEFRFASGIPVVLVGENNAGKSNLVRALDLVLGESWPGNHEPEDHEFYERNRSNVPIRIDVDVNGVVDPRNASLPVQQITWRFDPAEYIRLWSLPETGGERAGNNEVRGQCLCLVVEADRRLSYQLSYASRFTFLSKLMRHFHDKLIDDPARVTKLEGIFTDLRNTFQEVTEFATFTDELTTQVQELSGNLAYGLDIDLSAYNPSNYFRALRVQAKEGSSVREFDELGTGQQQILALSFAYAYAKAFHDAGNLTLIIEEPEANLHPLAQRWIARKVRELTAEDVQVAITTHSPSFLSMEGLEGLVVVSKDASGTKAVQLTRSELADHCNAKGAAKATPETILPFYAAAATDEILSGFFARRIVLVEGPTESLALPEYLAQVGLLTDRDGVAVISVGGVGNLAKWWRLFTAYEIPTYVIFDNDVTTEDPDARRRRDVLTAAGIPSNQIDSIVAETDWLIREEFAVFGQNFEESMRTLFGSEYIDLEDEAREQYGLTSEQSKPLVARYVAGRVSLSSHPTAQDSFKMLAEMIRSVAV